MLEKEKRDRKILLDVIYKKKFTQQNGDALHFVGKNILLTIFLCPASTVYITSINDT